MGGQRRGTEIEGYQAAPGEDLELEAASVGPRYFTTLRIPIVAGRDFDERDREGAPCVAIVYEAFARRYFTGQSPLGKRLAKFESFRTPERTEARSSASRATTIGSRCRKMPGRPSGWRRSSRGGHGCCCWCTPRTIRRRRSR